jgi:hypothetical protein
MRRFLLQLVFFGLTLVPGTRALAFALTGPIQAYQTELINFSAYGNDYGPNWRDEEYRWNIPLVTYGFDHAAIDYFGTNGMKSIEEAFKIFNDLPPVSQITDQVLSNYLFQASEANVQAQTLQLRDVKSEVLTRILWQQGVLLTEFYVWAPRSRSISANGTITNYIAIQRNFDPITGDPSAVVNGVTYGYSVAGDVFRTTPALYSTVSVGATAYGESFYGLTYDDVGGVRWIYRTNNFNNERVLPTVALRTGAVAATVGSGVNGNVWSGSGVSSNGVLVGGGVWESTGTGTTNTTGGAAGGGTATNAFAGVDIGLRGGMNKITFVRVNYDSVLGSAFINLTNRFVDQFKTNGVILSQVLDRQILQPDILFRVADLGLAGPPPLTPVSLETLITDPINNYDINNSAPGGTTAFGNGPGVMVPGETISFSNLMPWYLTTTAQGPGQTPTGPPVFSGAGVWATFDSGTITDIYPAYWNLQIADLEQMLKESQAQP